jgi:hypothetical protein
MHKYRLGSSILKEDGEESQLNINLLMPPTHDAPHLILKVSKSKPSDANQKLTLMMDYIPRRELLTSLAYYDKYFKGLDEVLYRDIYRLADFSGSVGESLSPVGQVMVRIPPESVLSRLLQSPFVVNVDVPFSEESSSATELVESLCQAHINRWCDWVAEDCPVVDDGDDIESHTAPDSMSTHVDIIDKLEGKTDAPTSAQMRMANRDARVLKLYFEEYKFNMAMLLGSSYAPKVSQSL